MKDFEYYTTVNAPLLRFEDCKAYERRLRREIDDAYLTAAERAAQTLAVKQRVHKYAESFNAEYRAEERRLVDEFWRDARAELGYQRFLDADGVQLLESRARALSSYRDFDTLFDHLQTLARFAESVWQSGYKAGLAKRPA